MSRLFQLGDLQVYFEIELKSTRQQIDRGTRGMMRTLTANDENHSNNQSNLFIYGTLIS